MSPLEHYLHELAMIHASGAAVPETFVLWAAGESAECSGGDAAPGGALRDSVCATEGRGCPRATPSTIYRPPALDFLRKMELQWLTMRKCYEGFFAVSF